MKRFLLAAAMSGITASAALAQQGDPFPDMRIDGYLNTSRANLYGIDTSGMTLQQISVLNQMADRGASKVEMMNYLAGGRSYFYTYQNPDSKIRTWRNN